MRKFFILLSLISSLAFANEGVPIEQTKRGHWMVDVVINDDITYPFIIDTGAQGAIFPSELVNALGKDIASLPEVRVQGAVGTRNLKSMTVGSMRIGEQKVDSISGVVMDFSHMPEGKQSPGVLPYTFLNRFTPKFDLVNKRLTLLPKVEKGDSVIMADKKYTVVPFELKSGSFISVELNINKQKVIATLDSGAGNRLDMNWLAAESMGVKQGDNSLKPGKSIRGAGGKKLETLAYPDVAISINNTPLGNRTVHIADVPVLKLLHGDHPAANFGLGIFG